MVPFGAYIAQSWNDQERTCHIEGLSIDAAREIAKTHAAMGQIGRVMFQSPAVDAEDYCEVYRPDGSVLTGRFCEVTFVRVPGSMLEKGNGR